MEDSAAKKLERPRRVTLTLPQEKYELLESIAQSMDKHPGDVAREMVIEMLDGMIEMFGLKDGNSTLTSEQSLRRMFKMAMSELLDATNKLEETK